MINKQRWALLKSPSKRLGLLMGHWQWPSGCAHLSLMLLTADLLISVGAVGSNDGLEGHRRCFEWCHSRQHDNGWSVPLHFDESSPGKYCAGAAFRSGGPGVVTGGLAASGRRQPNCKIVREAAASGNTKWLRSLAFASRDQGNSGRSSMEFSVGSELRLHTRTRGLDYQRSNIAWRSAFLLWGRPGAFSRANQLRGKARAFSLD
jgi:hypothetical protein